MTALGAKDRFFVFLGTRKLTAEELQRQQALDAQEKARKDAKSDAATLKKEQDKQAKAAKDEVIYNDRLARMELALGELKSYRPAADDIVKNFEAAIASGRVLAKDQDFVGAGKKLHEVHLSGALEQAEAAYAKAETAAKKKFPDSYAKLGELEKKLARADLPLMKEEKEKLLADARATVKPLNQSKAISATGADAVQELAVVETRFNQQVAVATNKQSQAKISFNVVKKKLDDLGPLVPALQLAGIQERIKHGVTFQTGHEYDAALEQFGLAGDALALLKNGNEPAFDVWAQRAPRLKPLRAEIVTQRERLNGSNALPELSRSLGEDLDSLDRVDEQMPKAKPGERPRAPTTMTYQTAVQTIEDGEVAVKQARTQIDEYDKFRKAREGARVKFRDAYADTSAAFVTLHDMVSKVDAEAHPDTADRYFRAEMEKVQEAWRQRYPNASTPETLGLDTALTELGRIKAKILEAANDGASLAGLLGQAATDDSAKRYGTALKSARDAVASVMALDTKAGQIVQNKLFAIEARAASAKGPGDYRSLRKELEALTSEAQKKSAETGDGLGTLRSQLDVAITGVAADLEILWDSVKAIRDTSRRDIYVKLHDTYAAELDTQRAMAKVKQIPLLEECRRELIALQAHVTEALEEFERSGLEKLASALTLGKVMKATNPTVADLKGLIAKQRDRLKDNEVRAFQGDTAFNLDQDLQKIEKSLGTEAMSAAAAKVAAIGVKIDEAETKTEEARKIYDAFKKGVKAARANLDDKLFEFAPKVKAGFAASLDAARADARREGGMALAEKSLANIIDQIDRKLDIKGGVDARGVPTALAADEQGQIDAANKAELARKMWEGQVKVLMKRIDRMPDGVSSDEKSALKERLEKADKDYKKSGDPSPARAQYGAIEQRIGLVSGNPQGVLVHARKQLPSAGARWKAAVQNLRNGLQQTQKSIVAEDDAALTDDIRKKVESAFADIKGMFNGAVFDRAIAAITKADADDKARAAARESALREIRHFQAAVNKDFRLRALDRAPFGDGMKTALSEIKLALVDLENNLMISL